MIFKKVIATLFLSFSAIMLFVFLIRLSKGKEGFLGLNDLFTYVENVDLNKPLEDFRKDITILGNSWNYAVNPNEAGSMQVITSGTFSQIYKKLPAATSDKFQSFENRLMAYVNAIAETLVFPFKLVYDIINLVIQYIAIFIDFMNWIITFEGYIPTTT